MITSPPKLMVGNNFLDVRHISYTYVDRRREKSIQALQDISLVLEQGKVLALVGSSGCGKSTFLKILAGLLPPTSGQVFIDNCLPLEYQQRQGIGFAFQKPLMLPWKSVLQNILLPVKIRNKSTHTKYQNLAFELIKMLGLVGFEMNYPQQLSGGMLQRAAIARALINQPKLLLLDEPFSALDEITRENLWVDFNKIWRSQGVTTILVTHSIREAVFLADYICVISAKLGRVEAQFDVSDFDSRDRKTLMQPDFMELCETVRGHLL